MKMFHLAGGILTKNIPPRESQYPTSGVDYYCHLGGLKGIIWVMFGFVL